MGNNFVIHELRIGTIRKCLALVRWLTRPSIRGHRILQHYEVMLEMELEPVPAKPRLMKVRRGTLAIGLEKVLEVGRNEELDAIDELEQATGRKERTWNPPTGSC